MVQLQVLQKIGILTVSMLLGYVYYFWISREDRSVKLQNGSLMASMLINFVIYLWVGKIVMHGLLFIQDPLAVLAYPSDARAFYFATGLSFIHVIGLIIRKGWPAMRVFTAFFPAFFAASFVFECIQILVLHQGIGWEYLALLMLLLLVHMVCSERCFSSNLVLWLLLCWSTGQFILAITMPYTNIFGFIIAGWFFGVITLCTAGGLLFQKWHAVNENKE